MCMRGMNIIVHEKISGVAKCYEENSKSLIQSQYRGGLEVLGVMRASVSET